VLYQCGSPKPDASAPGVAGLTSPRFFQVPLYKAALLDTGAGAFMAELDVVDRVQLTSPYSSTPCLQKISDTCGKVVSVTYDANFNTVLNDAQLAANDAIFLSDRDYTVFGPQTDPRTVVFSSYNSPGALQRAEWIKAMAPFFNKEYEAQAIFERVRAAYNGLKRADTLKRTLWTKYWPVSTAVASISFSFAAFKVDFSRDAGAPIVPMSQFTADLASVVDTTLAAGKCTISATKVECGFPLGAALNAVKGLIASADVIIDETYSTPSAVTLASIMTNYGLNTAGTDLKTGATVLRLDGILSDDGSYDWFERAVARPDLVLDSLRRVIDAPTVSHRWFRVISAAGAAAWTELTASVCTRECGASITPICPYAYVDCATNKLVAATPATRCGPLCNAGGAASGALAAAAAAAALLAAVL
jgi:hypothetical protein